ncbi:MAG TPA: hypothetical protein VFX12_15705 [Vicinamibacterales bacterium]|nr:hypothetical protein [Vicinamibacterales bacterium]
MAIHDEGAVPLDAAARERRFVERRTPSVTRVELAPALARVSWSGVWGGFLIALGIWITLAALGAGIGLSGLRPNVSVGTAGLGTATGAWLYVTGLIALFFGGAFGTRLAMVVDGAVAWLEATLIWTFALVLAMAGATALVSVAAAYPAAAQAVVQGNPAAAATGGMSAAAWLTFIGIVVAWVVTVVGSFWGRAQARGRAHALGLAA